jgi:hypothetical protein
MRLGLGSFPSLRQLTFMDGLRPAVGDNAAAHTQGHACERAHAEGVKGGERKGAGGSAGGRPHVGWEETGDQYLEKLEHLAESAVRCAPCNLLPTLRALPFTHATPHPIPSSLLTCACRSVDAWKRGLGAIGRKSLNATRTVTSKSIEVATLGQVKVLQKGPGAGGVRAGSDAGADGGSASSAGRQAALTPHDFFDGAARCLLSEAACTRLSDAVNVKVQLDTLLGLLEADDDFAGRTTCEPSAADAAAPLPSEWIHSEMYEKKVSDMYEKVRTRTYGSLELEMRPLLQWLAATVAAALTDEGGAAPNAAARAFADLYPGGVHVHERQLVKRGPDWKYGAQDGGAQQPSGAAAEGTVLEVQGSGWCTVQWPNGAVEKYRSGAEGTVLFWSMSGLCVGHMRGGM